MRCRWLFLGIFSGLLAETCGGLALADTAPPVIQLPDFNVDGTLPVFDLAETPLGVTLLQRGALLFRDAVLKHKVEVALDEMQPAIDDALKAYPAGYLIEVNLFVDETGQVDVPGGQLLTPIGIGLEPVDSLAEFDRVPHIRASPPASFRNQCFYIWVANSGGSMKATVMDQAQAGFLRQSASAEAVRRNNLQAFTRALPDGASQHIQRADYWYDAYQRLSTRLRDERTRSQIQALNQQAQMLQDQMNTLLKQYHDTLAAMAEIQANQSLFGKIGSLASMLNNAVTIGNGILEGNENGGKLLSTSGNPDGPIVELELQQSTEQTSLDGTKTRIEQDMKIKINAQGDLDNTIWNAWQKSGVPVPMPDPIPKDFPGKIP